MMKRGFREWAKSAWEMGGGAPAPELPEVVEVGGGDDDEIGGFVECPAEDLPVGLEVGVAGGVLLGEA